MSSGRDVWRAVDAVMPPGAWDLDVFVGRVAAVVGRPVRLVRLRSLPVGEPCGLVVVTPRGAYVFYPGQMSGVFVQHLVLHELGHLVLGHHLAAVDPELAVIERDPVQEAEAELFALMVAYRAGLPGAPEVSPRAAGAAFALRLKLGRRRG